MTTRSCRLPGRLTSRYSDRRGGHAVYLAIRRRNATYLNAGVNALLSRSRLGPPCGEFVLARALRPDRGTHGTIVAGRAMCWVSSKALPAARPASVRLTHTRLAGWYSSARRQHHSRSAFAHAVAAASRSTHFSRIVRRQPVLRRPTSPDGWRGIRHFARPSCRDEHHGLPTRKRRLAASDGTAARATSA